VTQAYSRFRPVGISRKRFLGPHTALEETAVAQMETAQALFERGLSQFSAGRHRRARIYFEQLVKVLPESAQAHYLLGLTYKAMGCDEKAYEAWQEVMRLPDYDDANTEAKRMAQRLLDRHA
jgi:lipoprotein NlpI